MSRLLESDLSLVPRWHSVADVAKLLGFSETKVRMLIAERRLRSLKDGRSRKVLPEWVDEYVAHQAEAGED
jgi:excisionase family DNA binding protein